MKVYICEDDEDRVIKIFSSRELAETFMLEENKRYDFFIIEQKELWRSNPSLQPEIRELILAGKGNENPELIEFMEKCVDFNNIHMPFPIGVQSIQEFEVD